MGGGGGGVVRREERVGSHALTSSMWTWRQRKRNSKTVISINLQDGINFCFRESIIIVTVHKL